MLQPKDATETLLSNDGDSVLEGLTTNFFVVLPSVRKFGPYTNLYCIYFFSFLYVYVYAISILFVLSEKLSLNQGSRSFQKENIFTERRGTVIEKTWENIILQTAPLEGVLPGVIRKLILE